MVLVMIKSNIDLTSNEMFSRRSLLDLSNVGRRMFLDSREIVLYKMAYPWSIGREESCMKHELVFTGNAEDRYYKNLSEEAISRNYCDCCGEYLVKIPWDRTYGLCRKCDEEMERQYNPKDNFPWSAGGV